MTLLRTFVLVAGFNLHAFAQSPIKTADEGIPGPDEVQRAIDEFNRLKSANLANENEVTVVLEPPAVAKEPNSAEADGSSSDTEDTETPAGKPLLVSGKPPAETEPNAEKDPTEASDRAVETVLAVDDGPGPNVRVQSIRKGNGKIDPSTTRIRSSFPVKPLTQAPSGWQLEPNETAPVFTQEVEIQPGTYISLEITPHVLIPSADGINTFAISEPGYESGKGYRQENTVAAVLGESIDQLDRDAVKMGNVLSDLNRLLGSLPKPQTEEEQKAESP